MVISRRKTIAEAIPAFWRSSVDGVPIATNPWRNLLTRVLEQAPNSGQERALYIPKITKRDSLFRPLLPVNLEIILRDFFVDILRGRAKNSRWLAPYFGREVRSGNCVGF